MMGFANKSAQRTRFYLLYPYYKIEKDPGKGRDPLTFAGAGRDRRIHIYF
jgi:hypothetical protein